MIDNPTAIYLGLKVSKLSCFVQLVSFLGRCMFDHIFYGNHWVHMSEVGSLDVV